MALRGNPSKWRNLHKDDKVGRELNAVPHLKLLIVVAQSMLPSLSHYQVIIKSRFSQLCRFGPTVLLSLDGYFCP